MRDDATFAERDPDGAAEAGESLLGRLLGEPHAFELTTAIRVAEATAAEVEIRSDPTLLLAPTAIGGAALKAGTVRLTSGLAGLVGPYGALPPAYSEIVVREERRRSRGLSAFLDLFADPLLRFFVAALEKYRLPRLVRWRGLSAANGIAGALFALAGLRRPRLRAANRAGDAPVLRFAGFFAARTRNAAALRQMLAAHLGLPVEIEQFRGRWLTVPEAERTRLGAPAGARVGVDAMAGAAIRDHAGAFRIVVGPIGYADYLSLAPGSPRLDELAALARLYAGVGLTFDVQVVLRREDVPECRLGDAGSPPRLGWNTWARVAPAAADSRDAVIAVR